MLNSFDTTARFEQVIAETLMELVEIPTRRQELDGSALYGLTPDCADDIRVFEPMTSTLRSYETGQR